MSKYRLAVPSLTNAMASEGSGCSMLRIRTDSGSQYASREFRGRGRTGNVARVHLEERSGAEWHTESFHSTLKKEYPDLTCLQAIRSKDCPG